MLQVAHFEQLCHKSSLSASYLQTRQSQSYNLCVLVLQGKYLRLLQPQQLPTLFKSSLTAQLLSTLLTAALTAMAQPAAAADADTAAAGAAAGSDAGAAQQLSAEHAVGLMEGLVKVPRFDMMVMSLGSRDKAALRQLWEAAAAAADSSLQERMASVRPKYRL